MFQAFEIVISKNPVLIPEFNHTNNFLGAPLLLLSWELFKGVFWVQACLSPVCINMALALPGQQEREWWLRFPEGMWMDDLWKLAQAAWRLMVWGGLSLPLVGEAAAVTDGATPSTDFTFLLSWSVFIPPESLSKCKTCCGLIIRFAKQMQAVF